MAVAAIAQAKLAHIVVLVFIAEDLKPRTHFTLSLLLFIFLQDFSYVPEVPQKQDVRSDLCFACFAGSVRLLAINRKLKEKEEDEDA